MLRKITVRNNLFKQLINKRSIGTSFRAISVETAKLRYLNAQTPSLLRNCPQAQWQYRILRHFADLPSYIKVPLPALSPTMEVGTIVNWAKKEGEQLSEGDLLAEIETDKATMSFETPEEGYLAKILVGAGEKNIPVGKAICLIVNEESHVSAFKDYKDTSSGAAPAAPKAVESSGAPTPAPVAAPPSPAPAPSPVETAASADHSRVYVSPMAKRLAEQRNIRLQGRGTGLFDSITSRDLDGLQSAPAAPFTAAAPPVAGPYVDIPITNIRDVIAKRLLQSKQNVPHYYVSVDVNVDKILAARKKLNADLEKKGVKLSVNDFVIKAAALASKKVPEANSAWLGTTIRQYKNVDVSVAVSTDKGLITPIIFEANSKGISTISSEMKALAAKARDGKLQPAEFQGGTLSISNLGMFGVSHFTAIINPPQCCILAVGTTQTKLIPDEKSEKGFRTTQYMTVTLSSDHRIVDGAIAARWLSAFRENIEDPINMIL